MEAALRQGFAARGLPGALYVDNGSPFVSRQLERCLAVLGIRLVHSRPGQPQGRGKIERAFRTVREQFLVELETRGGARDLEELNRLFGAWVEGVYHHRVHSETGQTPMERFLAGAPPRLPSPAELREAFLWAEHRQVTKQALVSLFGNRYQVDPALVGATVELVFDPFDLAKIQVRYQQRPMGAAVPFQLGRHVHPHATPEADPAQAAPRPSGIDYLAMVEQRIAASQRQRIAYASLVPPHADLDDDGHPHPQPIPADAEHPADGRDHAASLNHATQIPTTVGPLGTQLHLATTITPDHPAQPAAGGATTTPRTNIEPVDHATTARTQATGETQRTEGAS